MERPIRVLQVVGCMDLGGAETFIMSIYRAIDKNKVQFDFVKHTSKKGILDDEIAKLGGKIYSCPQYIGKNHFVYCKWWDNFFVEHPEYHVIHGHVRSTAAIYLKIAKEYGLVTISHSHNTSNGSGASSIVKYIMQLPIRYTADYLFSCSDKAGIWMFGKKATQKSNYRMIPNSVDLTRFAYNANKRAQMREQLGIPAGDFLIGHVGRFITQKNHAFLVNVFAEYHKKNPNSRLLMLGTGELFEKIQKQCVELGIDKNVLMIGAKTNAEDYYQAMDAFIFPSLHEGLPVSVVEAQANGLPCLISNVITHDVNLTDLVIYLPLNDKNAWFTALDKAKSKEHKEISPNNKQKLLRFDSENVAKKLETFYMEQDEKRNEPIHFEIVSF